MDGGRVQRRQRGRDDDGATLVEFAIVLPLLLVLLFGIIEFGIAFNDYQSIRQGVREGARQAVVGDTGTVTSCDLNGPAASVADDAVRRVLCTTKARTGLGNDVRIGLRVVEEPPSGYKNDSMTVCAVRNVDSITGLFAPIIDDIPLKSKVQMRVESQDAALPAGSYLEIDPSGQGWSWC